MTSVRPNQRQIASLSRLLAASSHTDVAALLGDALDWLRDCWPADAGALYYVAPSGEPITVARGELGAAAHLIEQSRSIFVRGGRSDSSIGCYAVDNATDLLELQLHNGAELVGLLHLLVANDQAVAGEAGEVDEELLLLLVHAVGAEADKLSLLRRAEQDLRELNLLYRVGQVLASNLDLDTLLDSIQRYTPEVLGAERCSIMLHDGQRRELVFEAVHSNGSVAVMRVPDDRGIAGWVFTHGEGQIVNNVADDERFYNAVERQTAFVTRSIVCAPMCTREQTVGVIQVLNKVNGEPFNLQDLRLLTTLASQAAIAIENANLYASLAEERDRLLTKEAEVRHLIARELHDGPTQSVAAIAMNIEFTKRLLQLMPDQVPAELDNLLDLARKTSHDIRTLLFELRPLVLETKGLLGAVEQYVTRFRDPDGIRLRLDAPHELPAITREAEAATFMIIQEAVNNARKYAGPVEVVIAFRPADDWLVVTVRDAGRGFDLAAVQRDYNSRGSLGLLNMRERARLINAEFDMRSRPGHGTEVELRVPLIQERVARV